MIAPQIKRSSLGVHGVGGGLVGRRKTSSGTKCGKRPRVGERKVLCLYRLCILNMLDG